MHSAKPTAFTVPTLKDPKRELGRNEKRDCMVGFCRIMRGMRELGSEKSWSTAVGLSYPLGKARCRALEIEGTGRVKVPT